ncbi:unnamed protein product, partial [Choristocarpus tenellus]
LSFGGLGVYGGGGSDEGRVGDEFGMETCLLKAIWVPGSQILLAVICTQFVRVYDLSSDATTPLHTYYLPATPEDAGDGNRGSFIQDVALVPPQPQQAFQSPMSEPLPQPSLPPVTSGDADSCETGTKKEKEVLRSDSHLAPVLATAVVLTGSGHLFAKGITAPRKRCSSTADPSGLPQAVVMMDCSEGGEGEREEDRKIGHRLLIPQHVKEACGPTGVTASPQGESSTLATGATAVANTPSTAPVGAIRGPSPSLSSSQSYQAIGAVFGGVGRGGAAGGDVDDSMDELDDSLSLVDASVRRVWMSTATGNVSDSGSAATAAVAAARTAVGTASVASPANPSGTLYFSLQMGLLILAREGMSTLALRISGGGKTATISGGFVLLPSRGGKSGGVSGAGARGGTGSGSWTALENSTCPPPYWRFMDYCDGAEHLEG